MSLQVPYITLNDGNKIPQLGLGTWNSSKSGVQQAVYVAIKAGYRHIDCAFVYKNENEVGDGIAQAIKENLVKREDLFITSKCWLTYLRKDRVKICLEKTLKNLKLTYLDLYLIHWPMAFEQTDDTFFPESNGLIKLDETINICDTWSAFEKLKNDNLVKSIGISNFNIEQIKRILNSCKIKPVINQIECHPYLNQEELIEFCKKNDIQITSYSPLGSTPPEKIDNSEKLEIEIPNLLNDAKVINLSQLYNKSVAQILLRYHIEKGLIVIPKSVNENRIKQNLQIFDFKLNDNDVKNLLSLNISHRICSFKLKGVQNHKEYPFK